jgi:hypothetical protein
MIFNMTPFKRPITLVPVPALESSNYTYTGSAITPTVTGYDSALMTRAGTVSAVSAGTYSITYSLADPQHCRWADGTAEDKTLYWSINKARYRLYLAKTGTLQYRVEITAPGMLPASDAASFSLGAKMQQGRFRASVGDTTGDAASGFSAIIELTTDYSGSVTDYMTVTLTYSGSDSNIKATETAFATVTATV